MNNKKTGFTCGSFDLLHAGHAMMLKEAREYCDYLIVGIQSDPTIDRLTKNKPVQSYEERITMLKAIRYVDELIFYDTEKDLYELLKRINPDVRIIGADWEGKQYTGYDLNIPVVFNTRNHGFSTSELRKRVYEAELNRMK